jgi:tRNA(Glu) U13 pseudouridine synthase TruD
MISRLFLISSLCGLTACKLPEVNLATSEPLKVDIKVDLNVYQHSSPEEAAKADAADEEVEQIEKRKYNRTAEIQELKNQRYIAETHRGVLLLRQQPAGTYGEYVKKVVEDENTDRMKLMTAEAQKGRRELREIMQERYAATVQSAHAGEWIEVPDPVKPESWKLEQKR